MRKIRDYKVFKKSHTLTLDIYRITRGFPEEEKFGIVSQMRRAAYSIPANMVEGNVKTEKEFIYYLRISLGSCEELRYFLLLSKDLEFINMDNFNKLDDDVLQISKMINTLIKKVKGE